MMEVETVQQQRKGAHLKKRALKNKALGISFNEKDLNDYVTGFHKRKKKRRKEAQKQQNEALRRKRCEQRQRRKLERQLVNNGGVTPDDEEGQEEEGAAEKVQSIAEMKTYETDDLKVTVVTSEINPEDDETYPSERKEAAAVIPPHSVVSNKKQGIPINNKKSFKKVAKKRLRTQPRPPSKRDKRKGNNKRGKK